MGTGATDTVNNANLPPRNPGTDPSKPAKEFDSERAKAIADAEATAARIDRELASADNDSEPDTKAAAEPKTPSRFSPGGFTDEVADAVFREADSQHKLRLKALDLAERQAHRREFWDRNPSNNSANVKEAASLDLYWDPKEEGFVRQPYVSKDEAVIDADPEASRLYKNHLWDLTHNKPEEKSTFKRVMDAVCSHVEPCASNIEQMHQDKEAGMSHAEALNRGMARLTIFAGTMALPTPGPSGPIDISRGGPIATGAGGRPGAMPRNVPATDPAIPARGEPSVAQRPKPLETTGGGGSKGPPPRDQPTAVKDEAVPDPIDDMPTNPVPKKPLEQVGQYKIEGTKSFDPDTKIFSREIEGFYGDKGRITDTRPIHDLFNRFLAEAKSAGAKELEITGNIVRNPNIMRFRKMIEQVLGGTVEKIDAQTIVFRIPIR